MVLLQLGPMAEVQFVAESPELRVELAVVDGPQAESFEAQGQVLLEFAFAEQVMEPGSVLAAKFA
ncbi:MAG: hypothetical protein V3V02_02310 [Rhizobiaceae bacterium]